MSISPSYKVTSSTAQKKKKKTCYLYANTDLIMPVGEKKKKRKRNKRRVLVNHRGSDKALKLK